MFIWLTVFVISLIVLVKSSDFFTDSAEKIGIFLKIPPFIVGVTIVSFGTSVPELATSLIAVFSDSSEIVMGNVVGSNIANILLVLGIIAIINKKLKTSWEIIHVDLPLLVGSVLIIAIGMLDGVFSFWESVLCLLGYVVYISYTVSMQRKHKSEIEEKEIVKEEKKHKKLGSRPILILFISTFFIFLGSKYIVESIIQLSSIFNVGKEIIAASAVALGTSMSELMVSFVAIRKGKPEMALGNILGSNIFNSFVVVGVTGLITPLIITPILVNFALPVMIGATFFYFFVTQDKEVSSWEGWILVIIYMSYIGKLFELF